MDSRYWGKTLSKLFNLSNIEYKFNNNGSETEKSEINSTYWGGKACWQVISTAKKVSKYGVLSGPYFPVFRLNTEIYSSLRIQSEYRKIPAR